MIKVENITKSYGEKENKQQVLKNISLEIEDGDFIVILGASGSGKSTLLNVISGLERPDSGKISYDGEDITSLSDSGLTDFRKNTTGFIFQQYYLLPNMTAEKNVKMGAELAGNKDYNEIIKAVGLEEKKHKYPAELSGGEQQRVSVARALSKKPKVLFMDEPTGALDEKTGRSVLDYILKLHEEKHFTAVMVTHNANIAETANSVIKMQSGEIGGIYTNETQKSAYEIGWSSIKGKEKNGYRNKKCLKACRNYDNVLLRGVCLQLVFKFQFRLVGDRRRAYLGISGYIL